jgi:hypothetical protein
MLPASHPSFLIHHRRLDRVRADGCLLGAQACKLIRRLRLAARDRLSPKMNSRVLFSSPTHLTANDVEWVVGGEAHEQAALGAAK